MLDANLPINVYDLAATLIATTTSQLELHRKTREQSKGTHDLVTDLDIAIEHQLRDKLLEMLPGSSFAGEESTPAAHATPAVYRWVLDPIDGTINFARGYEFFTSVVCCLDEAGPLVAAIYQPAQDVLTIAVRGQICRQWQRARSTLADHAEGQALHVGNHGWDQSVHSIMLTPKLAASARQRSFDLIGTLLNETLGARVLVSQAYESLKLAEGGVSAVISLQSSGGWSRDAARLICESASGIYAAIVNQDQPDIRGFILVDTPENFAQLIAKLGIVGYKPID